MARWVTVHNVHHYWYFAEVSSYIYCPACLTISRSLKHSPFHVWNLETGAQKCGGRPF